LIAQIVAIPEKFGHEQKQFQQKSSEIIQQSKIQTNKQNITNDQSAKNPYNKDDYWNTILTLQKNQD